VQALVVASLSELLGKLDPRVVVAVDIPIGLTDAGARPCDVAARKFLKAPRASSVFPAPIRPVLAAATYEDARATHSAIDGKGISKQAFAIYPKIREVDAFMRSSPDVRGKVREVHPEVSFAFWNGRQPLAASKKSAAGAAEREHLIDAAWPGVREGLRQRLPRSSVKRDDLNDAFAALWTARRIAAGTAVTLPERPVRDSEGLVMEIVA
jgi:predicted RNase H-like nuclease